MQINHEYSISERELNISFARSSGPGGQAVNKVNTKAILKWSIGENSSLPAAVIERFFLKYLARINNDGEVVVQSDRHRDQASNREDCRAKLREMLLSVLYPPKQRKATKVPRHEKLRRRESKKHHSEKKRLRQKV